jgi:outer membrane protein TolC
LTLQPLVLAAIGVNPQVRATSKQWEAAQYQIRQNYAPADPTFTCGNIDSSKHFNAAIHTHSCSESFQSPGKALLLAAEASETATRLMYEAVHDLRARVETAYYHVLLDEALIAVNPQANLKQVPFPR